MVAPFAHYFGVRPWEMELLEHGDFLALEAQARAFMREAKASG